MQQEPIVVSVPYVFTSFSNFVLAILITSLVSVPYVFTSFSNIGNSFSSFRVFQYHTFLHHSQTFSYCCSPFYCFSTIRFYIILKQSSIRMLHACVSVPYVFTSFSNKSYPELSTTEVSVPYVFTSFSNTTTSLLSSIPVSVPYVFTSFSNLSHGHKTFDSFQYHTFLHHSQTSNSKMNRHHLRKTRYSNTFNRFHIDLYL